MEGQYQAESSSGTAQHAQYNPGNIMTDALTGSGISLQSAGVVSTNPNGTANFNSFQDYVNTVIQYLKTKRYTNLENVAKGGGTVQQQTQALAASGWDAGGYTSLKNDIVDMFGSNILNQTSTNYINLNPSLLKNALNTTTNTTTNNNNTSTLSNNWIKSIDAILNPSKYYGSKLTNDPHAIHILGANIDPMTGIVRTTLLISGLVFTMFGFMFIFRKQIISGGKTIGEAALGTAVPESIPEIMAMRIKDKKAKEEKAKAKEEKAKSKEEKAKAKE